MQEVVSEKQQIEMSRALSETIQRLEKMNSNHVVECSIESHMICPARPEDKADKRHSQQAILLFKCVLFVEVNI